MRKATAEDQNLEIQKRRAEGLVEKLFFIFNETGLKTVYNEEDHILIKNNETRQRME